jgi:hypothetical protein
MLAKAATHMTRTSEMPDKANGTGAMTTEIIHRSGPRQGIPAAIAGIQDQAIGDAGVSPGKTALGVEHRRTPGVAEPAGDRTEAAVCERAAFAEKVAVAGKAVLKVFSLLVQGLLERVVSRPWNKGKLTGAKPPVCTENLIRVDDATESPKLVE